MVKILSYASRPHLVQLYQNGKVVCDENCPMWTSLKICSHCVAVAHCLDCTQDFIGWFTSHSKKLNLTKLCTSNVTQNAGKKPLQNRYSQRKAKPLILSWTLHSSFISPSTTTINAPLLPIITLYHQRMTGIHFGSASSTNALQPVLDVEVNSQEQLMEVCQLHI